VKLLWKIKDAMEIVGGDVMRIDAFFDKQPEAQFIDELKRPYHSKSLKHFSRRGLFNDEVYVTGKLNLNGFCNFRIWNST